MSPDKRHPEGYPTDPAKRRQEERLEELLGALPEVKAPSSLRAEVMAELRATPPTLGMRFRRWWRGLGPWRVPIQLAPVAALIAVAVLGQDLLTQGPPRPESTRGAAAGEQPLASEMSALGLGREIAKLPEGTTTTAAKPPRTAESDEMPAEDFSALALAEEADQAEPEASSQVARASEADGGAARGAPAMETTAPMAEPEPVPATVALGATATETGRTAAPAEEPGPALADEPRDLAMARQAPAATEEARRETLPTPEEREGLIAQSLRLPPPEPAPSTESRRERAVGEIAATRVQPLDGTPALQAPGALGGTQTPASAMAINGSAMTADEFRDLRDSQVAYTPIAPTRPAPASDIPRVEADVTDVEGFVASLRTTLDQLGGRLIDRRALSAQRDVWHIDAQIPRWRLEELERRVPVLADPRLLETLTLIEDEAPRPVGSLTPRERELIPVQIIVYLHTLENIP